MLNPELALERARMAMHRRDYASAIAASEVAIASLLQPGVTLDELLRLCVAGAPAEGLLRFERHVLADRAQLSEPLALHWEALHRAGRRRDASLMQLLCQRYFAERASVWATSGNHALDHDDLLVAERYFQHCLELDPNWTAALAGLAIVHERRKDWSAALPYRRRVVELEHALDKDDAASLQRRLRYAAALARLGQWHAAEPLFRSAARSANITQLPAELPVLLRVFSQELYAPALVARLCAQAGIRLDVPRSVSACSAQTGDSDSSGTAAPILHDAALALAQQEAVLLDGIALRLQAATLTDAERRWALSLVAYLSGELEQAFALLDLVELDRPDDVAVHGLLWRCARGMGHEQTASILAFAERAARALWLERGRASPSPVQVACAIAILPELSAPFREAGYGLVDQLEPIAAPVLSRFELAARSRTAGCSAVTSDARCQERNNGPVITATMLSVLEQVAAFRATREVWALPLPAAAASIRPLAALAELLRG